MCDIEERNRQKFKDILLIESYLLIHLMYHYRLHFRYTPILFLSKKSLNTSCPSRLPGLRASNNIVLWPFQNPEITRYKSTGKTMQKWILRRVGICRQNLAEMGMCLVGVACTHHHWSRLSVEMPIPAWRWRCSCPSEEAPQTEHFPMALLPLTHRCSISCHRTALCHLYIHNRHVN